MIDLFYFILFLNLIMTGKAPHYPSLWIHWLWLPRRHQKCILI